MANKLRKIKAFMDKTPKGNIHIFWVGVTLKSAEMGTYIYIWVLCNSEEGVS